MIDFVLGDLEDPHEPALFYVSDHGESLGENGMYLHGLPYMIAPKAQTHVAMIVWGDDRSDLDIKKTQQYKDETYSHDSIAATLIKLFEIALDAPIKNSDEPIIFLKDEEELNEK